MVVSIAYIECNPSRNYCSLSLQMQYNNWFYQQVLSVLNLSFTKCRRRWTKDWIEIKNNNMHSKCFYHCWKIKRMSKRHILTYIFGRYLKPFRNPIGVLQCGVWSIGQVLRPPYTQVIYIFRIIYYSMLLILIL